MSDGGYAQANGGTGSNGEGGVADEVGGSSAGDGSNTGGNSASGGSSTGGSSASGGDGSTGGSGGCVPDTSCSCGAFQDHEYRFCAVLTTRDPGRAACQSANMGMIRVESAEENAWLLQQFLDRAMFMGTGGPIVLLGGNDIDVEGAWRWDDGTLFWNGGPVGSVYTNWSFAPKAGQGDCLGMLPDGTWEDRSCSSGNATVACESP